MVRGLRVGQEGVKGVEVVVAVTAEDEVVGSDLNGHFEWHLGMVKDEEVGSQGWRS